MRLPTIRLRSTLFDARVEANIFWLSISIMFLLLLEDSLFLSFLVEGSSSLYGYLQIYSVLIVLSVVGLILLYLFITDLELPYAVSFILLGAFSRFLAVKHLPLRSDVLQVSMEAAEVLLAGKNPYTNQAFAIFAYPPFEPIYYLPYIGLDARYGEVSASIATLILLYLIGKVFKSKYTVPVLSFYAFSGVLIASMGIGSNDTSAGMLIVLAISLLALSLHRNSHRVLMASAVAFGLAVCFKQFSIFFPMFALAYIRKHGLKWRRYLFFFSATILSLSLPYLFLSPLQFLRKVLSLHIAERIFSPQFILYYALPEYLKPYYGSPLWTLIHAATLTLIIILLVNRTKTLNHSIAYSIFTWLIALLIGRYLVLSYFAFLAPALLTLVLARARF